VGALLCVCAQKCAVCDHTVWDDWMDNERRVDEEVAEGPLIARRDTLLTGGGAEGRPHSPCLPQGVFRGRLHDGGGTARGQALH
jgi:hypothetical protein